MMVETHPHEVQALLGLGSNIHPGYNLLKAVGFLNEKLTILNVSNVWETSPIGTKGPNFLNAAVHVQTNLTPKQLKNQITRTIEIQLGRVRTPDKFAPRTIDIDLLIWDNILIDQELIEHAYIAVPASEVLPDYIPQGSVETLKITARRLNDSGSVVKCPNFSLKL